MTGRVVRLADVCEGRDNNFNLIRMIAALAVLVSHAWPIALGPGTVEPLAATIGIALGTLAVYVFFAISGFLIARSFETQPTLRRWLIARGLRLFPALFVVLVLTVTILGPLATALPLGSYFTHPETATYVVRNLSLAFLQHDLPGVFETNPYPGAINGSLWTLFYEVSWYAMVLLLGLAGALRGGRFAAFLALFLAAYGTLLVFGDTGSLHSRLRWFLDLGLPFAIGIAFYVWRRHLPLHPLGLALLVGAAVLARGNPVAQPLVVLALAYGVFVAGYLIGGRIRRYNALGDYSYGVYVYAFPMQQTAVFLFGPLAPGENILIATPAALFFAMLSWHWIEKPALGLGRGRTQRGLARPGPSL
jgi:peptidoglycan/LPS O-acetylase OafA/YrhL